MTAQTLITPEFLQEPRPEIYITNHHTTVVYPHHMNRHRESAQRVPVFKDFRPPYLSQAKEAKGRRSVTHTLRRKPVKGGRWKIRKIPLVFSYNRLTRNQYPLHSQYVGRWYAWSDGQAKNFSRYFPTQAHAFSWAHYVASIFALPLYTSEERDEFSRHYRIILSIQFPHLWPAHIERSVEQYIQNQTRNQNNTTAHSRRR